MCNGVEVVKYAFVELQRILPYFENVILADDNDVFCEGALRYDKTLLKYLSLI